MSNKQWCNSRLLALMSTLKGLRYSRVFGFTLLEVIIALMILVLGLTSIFSLFGTGTHSLYQGITDVTVTSCATTIFSELSTESITWSGLPENRYDQTHPTFPSNFKYDLEFIPLDSINDRVRDAGKNAVLVTLVIKWSSGRLEQSAEFQTVLLK